MRAHACPRCEGGGHAVHLHARVRCEGTGQRATTRTRYPSSESLWAAGRRNIATRWPQSSGCVCGRTDDAHARGRRGRKGRGGHSIMEGHEHHQEGAQGRGHPHSGEGPSTPGRVPRVCVCVRGWRGLQRHLRGRVVVESRGVDEAAGAVARPVVRAVRGCVCERAWASGHSTRGACAAGCSCGAEAQQS